MKNIIFTILVLTIAFSSQGQQVPADAQSEKIYLLGGTAHLGNGEVIENSCIAFEKGKITMVADATRIKINTEDGKLIDVSGKQIYPGLIALNTTLGLTEIGAVRATRDFSETGLFNPNVRASIAFNTDSRVTPTIRSNGIMIAQIVPRGGRISGTSAVMSLDGWNWEDAIIKDNDGVFVNWPSKFTRSGWWANNPGLDKNKNYDKQTSELKMFLLEAAAYISGNPEEENLKFEAMRGLFTSDQRLFIKVNGAKETMEALESVKGLNVNPVIVGGKESWLLADYLKDNDIPVVLGNLQTLPGLKSDDIDQSFKIPKQLADAGVLFTLTHEGNWDQRNLPFNAGQAVSYGLDKEKAIQAVTLDAAKILGIDHLVGSIEEGKVATIVVSSGDILDMRTNNIEIAFIDGKMIDIENKQTALYEKFRNKYVKQGSITE